MNKSIYKSQNESFLLLCQVAQRHEYSKAKRIAGYKKLFTFLFWSVSIIASFRNIGLLSAFSCLLGMTLIIFNKYSDEYVKLHKEFAASIQQYIDVTLFSSVLGSKVSDWGEILNESILANIISEYKEENTTDMINWYDDYSGLDVESQVFHCQLENIRWNYDMHKKYKFMFLVIILVIILILFILFFLTNPNFVKVICILSWFIPVAEYLFSNYREINKSCSLLQKIEDYCREIENVLMDKSHDIQGNLIKLQNMIMERRKLGFLIPDWFYRIHKNTQKIKENRIAETIVSLKRKER